MFLVSKQTQESYLEANYSVYDHVADTVHSFRIGERSMAIEQLLMRHNCAYGLIFTAWNPHSREQSMAVNKAANQQLRQHPIIRSTAIRIYAAFGSDDANTWQEDGFFFVNIGTEKAKQLCVEFAQNAGVWIAQGQTAELLWHPRARLL